MRPVVLELDPRDIQANLSVLLPRGLVADVMAEPTTLAAVRGAAVAHFAAMDQLGSRLAREPAARDLVNEVMRSGARIHGRPLSCRARRMRPAESSSGRGARTANRPAVTRAARDMASALASDDGPGVPAAPVQPSRR